MSYHPQLAEAIAVLFPNATLSVDYIVKNDGTGPVISKWLLPNPQPTEQEVLDAVPLIPATYNVAQKAKAKDDVDNTYSGGRVTRAEAQLIIDELNILRALWMSFKAEVAASTTLADLKTRVAGLPNTTPRTKQQAIAAIKSAIDADA